MDSENVITWNFPNVITVWLMIALMWAAVGVATHFFLRKKVSPTTPAVASDQAGNLRVVG